MDYPFRFLFRWRQATSVVLLAGLASASLAAEDPPPPAAISALINRLAERGALSAADAKELQLLAEADAAEAVAQQAALKAAEARAVAAEARARAYAAIAARGGSLPAPGRAAAPQSPSAPEASLADEPRVVRPATRAAVAPPAPLPEPEIVAEETAEKPEAASMTAETAPEPALPDDTVRVTYVPEVVQQRLREQVKQDVLDEARAEGWATPHAVPDWVSRFRFFGDLRTRYEGMHFPSGNENTGSFVNFNAINTGSPYDLSDSNPNQYPQLNVDQDRQRLRIRARLGTALELGDGFAGGFRLASGDSNSPVSQNQTLGGQGGDFSKYATWIDRAFLRYEAGGLPDQDLMLTLGRQDNPYLSTSMIWADDLGFDGLTASGRLGFGDSITGFLTAGAYPVFNTDLNFASNQGAKFKSTDKWLYAVQLGTTLDLGESIALKIAAAYYPFSGVEGRLSSPVTLLSAADVADTDSTRPGFAQKGNTYMPLRNITPGPLNNQGNTNQFQYFGLASKFRPLVADLRLEFNHFEPFQIALSAEYVKNLAFDAAAVSAVAVSNRGAVTTADPLGVYVGTDSGWIAALTVGQVALQKRWDWNAGIGYRNVGSDAMVDGFVDSDFGGGGTNVKGLTFTGNLALSSRLWLTLRWMSAQQSTGPQLKSDVFQFDVNGKF